MKISIILICLCLYVSGEQSCKSKAQDSKSETHSNSGEPMVNNPKPQNVKYEVLMRGCSEDGGCVVIAYCASSLFNEKDMRIIAEKLSIEFREKKVVNVNLFDNKGIAKSYAKGTRNLGDLDEERRGWYLRTDDREFLLFFPDPSRRGKQISIKLEPKP